MSDTSMTREMTALVEAFGWDLDDLRWVTINAMKSAFAHFEQRLAIINERDQARVRRAGCRRSGRSVAGMPYEEWRIDSDVEVWRLRVGDGLPPGRRGSCPTAASTCW